MTAFVRILYLALMPFFVGGATAQYWNGAAATNLPLSRNTQPFSNGIAPCGPTPVSPGGSPRPADLVYGTTRYFGNLILLPDFVVADVNKDGVPDIVASQNGASSIAISFGDSSHPGTFLAPIFVAVPTATPFGVSVADLNGDGFPDILYTDGYNSANILFQNPQHPGTFAPSRYLGASSLTPLVADMNHDGTLDVILISSQYPNQTDSLQILFGDPLQPGSFLPSSVVSLPHNSFTWIGAVADMNGDGLLDIVIENYFAFTVSVLLNDAAHPGTLLPRVDYPITAFVDNLALGDLNGDGLPDVVLGGVSSGVCVLLNNAARPGTLLPETAYATTATAHNGGESLGIALGDVNGDGKLDVVSGNVGGVFDLFLGNGDGTFAPAVPYPTGPTPDTFDAVRMAIADVDGDGLQDVIAGQFYQNNVQIFPHRAVASPLAITATDQTLTRYAGVMGDTTDIDIRVTAFQGIPQGTVTLFDSGGGLTYAQIAVLPLDKTGGTVYTTPTQSGPHAFISRFPGDSVYAPSTSLIDRTRVPGFTLSLAAAPNPAALGQNVTVTATTPVLSPVPIGNIVFSDEGVVLGSVSISATGTTIFNTSSLALGTHTLTASYTGDTVHAPQQATATELIRNPVAQFSLTSSLNPAGLGQAVTFSAKVSASGTTPTGRVSLMDNATPLTTVPLAADGTVSYTTSTLTAGSHLIQAAYSGDALYAAQTGTLTEVIVTPSAPPVPPPAAGDFALATGAALTLGVRQSGTSMLAVTPLNGLADTISLNCGALPPYVTCQISPISVTLNGTAPQQAILQIATGQSPAYTAFNRHTSLLLAALSFLVLPWRRNILRTRLIAFLLLAPLLGGLAGCGFIKSPLSTPPGTYSIVLHGQSAATHLDRTATLTLLVR